MALRLGLLDGGPRNSVNNNFLIIINRMMLLYVHPVRANKSRMEVAES